MSFQGKVVIITGASAGIGAATAVRFAKEGASVTIVGRNEDRLKNVATLCQENGAKILTIKADITVDEEAKGIVKKTIDHFGKLDVLVNNAAIAKQESLLIGDLMETFDETIKTNLRAVVQLTKLATPYLVESKGNIVNVSSIMAQTFAGAPQYISYCTSKAALNHFTRGVALTLGPLGVRANIVSPGPVETDMLLSTDIALDKWKSMTILNQISDPEEIADMIVFIASDKAKSVTGSVFLIDNGLTLKL